MRKIVTFILFASLANNIACSSGFERAVPKNLQDVATGPIDLNQTPAPKAEDGVEKKDDVKTTHITPTFTGGDLDGRPTMTAPAANGPDPKAPANGITEQAELRKMDKAFEDRDAQITANTVAQARITPVTGDAQPTNTNTNVPVLEAIAPKALDSAPPKALDSAPPKTEASAATATTSARTAEQADVRKAEAAMEAQPARMTEAEQDKLEREGTRPLEWAFSELRVILPDTLASTAQKDVNVVIANNALMTSTTAKFRLAGEKSYMLCRAAAEPALVKGDTFAFVSAFQKEWSTDKRFTIATLVFKNNSTQKGLKFTCLMYGSKTEADFKANMRDIVEFRNHQGLYN
ncbi:MAG: hypothetical protein H7326_11715 [Bdellovibrionaceae bacterium]|nr:hypothetical protein [Pseudobdellovibrionaceae bacterium]